MKVVWWVFFGGLYLAFMAIGSLGAIAAGIFLVDLYIAVVNEISK